MSREIIYMLEEASPLLSKPEIISSGKKGGIKYKATYQDADTVNGNGKIYSKASLNDVIRLAQPLMEKNAFVGERNHPADKSPQRFVSIDLGNISHRILSLGWNGNLLEGVGQTLSTQAGKDMRALIEEDNMTLSFSLRALGNASQGNGRTPIVTNVSKLVAYDWVANPSHKSANILHLVEDEDVSAMLLKNSGKISFLQESLGDTIMLCESNLSYDVETNIVKFSGNNLQVKMLLEQHISDEFKASFSKLLKK